MDDGEFAIALKGIDFRERWRSTSMEELFLVTSATMPQDRPGRLDDEMYADILAYVLQENRTEPGTEELPPDPQALLAMAPPDWARPWGGGLAPDVVLPPAPSRSNPLDRIRPVTDAMLYDPDDGDWLLWRRTYDASGLQPTDANQHRQRRGAAGRVDLVGGPGLRASTSEVVAGWCPIQRAGPSATGGSGGIGPVEKQGCGVSVCTIRSEPWRRSTLRCPPDTDRTRTIRVVSRDPVPVSC